MVASERLEKPSFQGELGWLPDTGAEIERNSFQLVSRGSHFQKTM